MNALLIIDKPSGMTSHDVVNRVRRILSERSVGHLGTLDPMATGVLPLVIGNLTRLAQFYRSSIKIYEGAIRFGYATDTYDANGRSDNCFTGDCVVAAIGARNDGQISGCDHANAAAVFCKENKGRAGIQTRPQTPENQPRTSSG